MAQKEITGPNARIARDRRLEDREIQIMGLSLRSLSVHLVSVVCRGIPDLWVADLLGGISVLGVGGGTCLFIR